MHPGRGCRQWPRWLGLISDTRASRHRVRAMPRSTSGCCCAACHDAMCVLPPCVQVPWVLGCWAGMRPGCTHFPSSSAQASLRTGWLSPPSASFPTPRPRPSNKTYLASFKMRTILVTVTGTSSASIDVEAAAEPADPMKAADAKAAATSHI